MRVHATNHDAVWFAAHPKREYRLRRQTPAELVRWPAPLREGLTGWCVIRRSDSAMELVALGEGEAGDNHDLDLGLLFDGVPSAA